MTKHRSKFYSTLDNAKSQLGSEEFFIIIGDLNRTEVRQGNIGKDLGQATNAETISNDPREKIK